MVSHAAFSKQNVYAVHAALTSSCRPNKRSFAAGLSTCSFAEILPSLYIRSEDQAETGLHNCLLGMAEQASIQILLHMSAATNNAIGAADSVRCMVLPDAINVL